MQAELQNRVIPRVNGDHEKMFNDDPVEFSSDRFLPGDVAHQGDIMIVCLKSRPKGKAKVRENRQIAEGNTQGSRHVLESGQLFDYEPNIVADAIYEATGCRVDPQYCGPVFCTEKSSGNATLSHPEHGNHTYSGQDMWCASVYQRNFDAEEQAEKRARD